MTLIRFAHCLTLSVRMSLRERSRTSQSSQGESDGGRRATAAVVVLGDIGRSPRMQYHAASLAQDADFRVSVVGYLGSETAARPELLSDPNVRLVPVAPFPNILPRSLLLLYAPFKLLFLLLQLFVTLLFRIPAPDVILVQNPPSIPTLAVVVVAKWLLFLCKWHRSRIVIDWHNFGYTILQMSFRKGHPVIAVARVYERILGAMADDHLCVTAAMQAFLKKEWGISARVLHDHPPSFFHRVTDVEEKDLLFQKLLRTSFAGNASVAALCQDQPGEVAIGEVTSNGERVLRRSLVTESVRLATGEEIVREREQRPVIVVSGTSWTADEDFAVLLDAAVRLDAKATEAGSANVLFVITGKGPLREYYEREVAKLEMRKCHIVTAWLATEDYPALLGCADLGVSLHTSSSGLDLPMKVVDMFGCNLPVCAIDFQCIGELVRHGDNGYVFSSSEQLARQMEELFEGFPSACSTLEQMRSKATMGSWQESWLENALPALSVATGDAAGKSM